MHQKRVKLQYRSVWIIFAIICALGAQTGFVDARRVAHERPWAIDGFNVGVFADGLDRPVAFAFLPDGAVLIAEQGGVIRYAKSGVTRAKPVLDINARVNARAERGLLGLAVDPKFDTNGYIYVLFSRDAPGEQQESWDERIGVLARYTVADGAADPASEKILLDDYASFTAYHSLGALRFAPDGALFVSMGDASTPGDLSATNLRALDPNTLHGKLLRIDPSNGAGVVGNPFFDPAVPKSARSRVWALGLRNGFRFGLQPVTGIPYVGNVGWFTNETIVRAAAGANFGWPCAEGETTRPEYQKYDVCKNLDYKSLTKPLHAYQRQNDKNAAVIGGAFNSGRHFPPSMQGDYFFTDFAQGFIRRARLDARGEIVAVVPFAQDTPSPVDLQFGRDGALYMLSYERGMLFRITYPRDNLLPQPRIDVSLNDAAGSKRVVPSDAYVIHATAPATVTFDASQSVDLDRQRLAFEWRLFEDAQARAGVSASRVYTQPGRYLAQLTATDTRGFANTVTRVILVAPKPNPGEIISLNDGDVVPAGALVPLTATLPTTDRLTIAWSVVMIDGQISRTVEVSGTPASFRMPALSNAGRVEVRAVAREASGAVRYRDLVTAYAPSDDGYIRGWWFIRGSPERYLYFDALRLGERNVAMPDSAMQSVWKRTASRKIDLAAILSPPQHTAGYAFVWIESPEERSALLGMVSDDGIAAWVNGALVWRHSVSRYVEDDERDLDLPSIRLKKGLNGLLIKVDQNVGEWAFKARVLNPDGSVMKDIALRAAP
jgi:glucose/arabinose dehydrogenase